MCYLYMAVCTLILLDTAHPCTVLKNCIVQGQQMSLLISETNSASQTETRVILPRFLRIISSVTTWQLSQMATCR